MARKNPFANLMGETSPSADHAVADYPIRGASRSLITTIDELAERADRLLEGETVIEIEPDLLDASFVQDRIDDGGEDYTALLEAIRERGQDSPILVRPHPKAAGRYMIVFGHRRAGVARALGRKVRAVVKDIADVAHVVAQGQENAVRANLSFIEKAIFATRLSRLNYDSDNAVVLAALSIDRTTLSKMLSVTGMPGEILSAIGAARNVGRDRWYELKILLERPANLDRALAIIATDDFQEARSDARFSMLFDGLKRAGKALAARAASQNRSWASDDKAVSGAMSRAGKIYTLSLKGRANDAVGFGEFISDRLAELYASYRETRMNSNEGD